MSVAKSAPGTNESRSDVKRASPRVNEALIGVKREAAGDGVRFSRPIPAGPPTTHRLPPRIQ